MSNWLWSTWIQSCFRCFLTGQSNKAGSYFLTGQSNKAGSYFLTGQSNKAGSYFLTGQSNKAGSYFLTGQSNKAGSYFLTGQSNKAGSYFLTGQSNKAGSSISLLFLYIIVDQWRSEDYIKCELKVSRYLNTFSILFIVAVHATHHDGLLLLLTATAKGQLQPPRTL